MLIHFLHICFFPVLFLNITDKGHHGFGMTALLPPCQGGTHLDLRFKWDKLHFIVMTSRFQADHHTFLLPRCDYRIVQDIVVDRKVHQFGIFPRPSNQLLMCRRIHMDRHNRRSHQFPPDESHGFQRTAILGEPVRPSVPWFSFAQWHSGRD